MKIHGSSPFVLVLAALFTLTVNTANAQILQPDAWKHHVEDTTRSTFQIFEDQRHEAVNARLETAKLSEAFAVI